MKKIIFLFLFISSCIISYPQVKCIYKTTKSENHFVYRRGKIKLFSGQRIIVSSPSQAGRLKHIALIDTAGSHITNLLEMSSTIEHHNAEKHICIDVNQITTPDGNPMTVLLIKNPYRKRLTYKAKILTAEKKRFTKTDVLPIIPGLSGIITWPYPVTSVILYKFRVSRE
jgi:hypothetical protein